MNEFVAADAASMRALGARIGSLLVAGDVLILNGPLGAGKTTLTQGIAEGMKVRGPITSPTFVISRIHPSIVGGPALIHVDAYRINSLLEVNDLDLDSDLAEAVLVAEWGAGKIESLTNEFLLVDLQRSSGDERTVSLTAHGARPEAIVAALL